MMKANSYPTPSWLQEAMLYPRDFLIPKKLRKTKVEDYILGLPGLSTGANSAVFKITIPEGVFALKCFTQADKWRHKRYRRIQKHLPQGKDSPFQKIEYHKRGFLFDKQKLPILLYPWLDLPNIFNYVELNLNNTGKLEALLRAIENLEDFLSRHDIAHGDLQHANMFISEQEGSSVIKLIDYDQLFMPATKRLTSLEIGHRNYQHPDRDRSNYNANTDRFSFIAIWLAVRSLILMPGLWSRFSDGENLLFRHIDFQSPRESELLEEIGSNDSLRGLAERFTYACELQIESVPTLSAFSGISPIEESYWIENKRSEDLSVNKNLIKPKTNDLEESILALENDLAASQERISILLADNDKVQKENEDQELDIYIDRALQKYSVSELEISGAVSHKVIVRLKAFNLRSASDLTVESVNSIFGLAPATKSKILSWAHNLRQTEIDNYGSQRSNVEYSDPQLRRLKDDVERKEERLDILRAELNDLRDS